MTPQQRLAEAFVALSGSTTDGPLNIPVTLSVLADRTPPLLGVRAAAVVFAPEQDGAVQVAGSDPEVYRLEHDAAGWCEGPGHDCHRRLSLPSRTALAGRPARQRWPHYTPRAVGLGYTSVVALPLREHTRTSGALILLSDGQSPLPSDMLALGQSMADFTAVALHRAREADRSRTLTAQLEHALTTHAVIEQAKGVIATRLSLPMDDAFALLRKHARAHQRRVRDVAREIVEGRADPRLTEPTL
ncbi:ANTAR domain-containing response regulator [Streptomyces sp. HUAS TT7]|uniref:ANTAR domain-containing response regulator n=1 Tax=Streptomyces sp. HUAS TT7 TaxID=3447507 RepID=UPI003F65D630